MLLIIKVKNKLHIKFVNNVFHKIKIFIVIESTCTCIKIQFCILWLYGIMLLIY